jgi:uncharacterized membrane protein YfcA
VIGGAIGAYTLTAVPARLITPWVSLYLAGMGLRILYTAWRPILPTRPPAPRVEVLGFTGGLLDAMGGGGWGPIVTSTLVGQGREPRWAIGSVNRAEFFVTLAQSAVFVTAIGLTNWRVIAALCLGGAAAAPVGALVARRARPQHLMVLVGLLILALSVRTFVVSW